MTCSRQGLSRFSLACDLFSVGAKLVFALGVWAITRIAPTQDA